MNLVPGFGLMSALVFASVIVSTDPIAGFWEYLAFALNSVVFLLIGLEVQLASLVASWKPILLASAAVLAGRAVVVYGVSALLRFTSERVPWSWSAVLTWSGLRGAIS